MGVSNADENFEPRQEDGVAVVDDGEEIVFIDMTVNVAGGEGLVLKWVERLVKMHNLVEDRSDEADGGSDDKCE